MSWLSAADSYKTVVIIYVFIYFFFCERIPDLLVPVQCSNWENESKGTLLSHKKERLDPKNTLDPSVRLFSFYSQFHYLERDIQKAYKQLYSYIITQILLINNQRSIPLLPRVPVQ